MNRPRPAVAASGGKKASAFGLIGLLVGLSAGYAVGRFSTGTSVNPLSTAKGGSYQEGYDAAKKKIDDAHVFPPAPTQATFLNGTIKSVGASSLVVEVTMTSPNPLEVSTASATRTVNVSKDTKITKHEQKSPEEVKKEFDDFQKGLAAGGPPLDPPQSFKQVPIELGDLKAGDFVMMNADHDILKEASFAATGIDLITSAVVPPSAAANPSVAPNGVPAPSPPGQPAPSGSQGTTGAPPPTPAP